MNIILFGKMGSGKDTVAEYLARTFEFRRVAFGDKIKQAAKDLFPWHYDAETKPRKLLQDLGTQMREMEPDVWIRHAMQLADQYTDAGEHVVISDGRQQNEKTATEAAGFIPVKVWAPDDLRRAWLIERDGTAHEETWSHHNEKAVDVMDFRYMLVNQSTKAALYQQVNGLITMLREQGSGGCNVTP